MTTAKMNQAIIKAIMDALKDANFDPEIASLISPKPGLFASVNDRVAAETTPEHIIWLLKYNSRQGNPIPREEIENFVKREVWKNTTSHTISSISLEDGLKQLTYVKEVREGIEVLRGMGVDVEAIEFDLEMVINEITGKK